MICKHCGSYLGAAASEHQGLCPYCKESIKPGATVCKHCRSRLGPEANFDRGWGHGYGRTGWRGRLPDPMGWHHGEHHRHW
ncbi:hypothetical protein KIH31_05290 [Paenarthrobacter sp. DKR-5]|nr:hypothetical protein [Paenarthrobacter sp. DKR-5]